MTDPNKSVLFVCLGNICRSPMAEAIFLHLLQERKLEKEWKVSSAGLGGWHVGKLPDARARSVVRRHGIEIESLARQIETEDFSSFHFIFGMDDDNIFQLNGISPEGSKCTIQLLGDFHPDGSRSIQDPYYESGEELFEKAFNEIKMCLVNFLDQFQSGSLTKGQ